MRSIAFRRAPAPVDCIPFTVEVEIGVGHSPRSAASFGWERPMNRGPDFEIVLARKSLATGVAALLASSLLRNRQCCSLSRLGCGCRHS